MISPLDMVTKSQLNPSTLVYPNPNNRYEPPGQLFRPWTDTAQSLEWLSISRLSTARVYGQPPWLKILFLLHSPSPSNKAGIPNIHLMLSGFSPAPGCPCTSFSCWLRKSCLMLLPSLCMGHPGMITTALVATESEGLAKGNSQ